MSREISSGNFGLELNTSCNKYFMPYIIGLYSVTSDGNNIRYFKGGKEVPRDILVDDLMDAFNKQIVSRLIRGACDDER